MTRDDDVAREAARLLFPLRDAGPGGPGVDVARAVREGRRRRRVRRAAAPVVAALVVALVTAALALLAGLVPGGTETPPADDRSRVTPTDPPVPTGPAEPSWTDGGSLTRSPGASADEGSPSSFSGSPADDAFSGSPTDDGTATDNGFSNAPTGRATPTG
ncbi:hypothetical protein [Streptomyces litchfieldiae]|uniref:Serine/threonine protein kinase n=1 Tax=Streptomyces litchfieldiae TaxID=3075543 RepID=A0ABU2MY24_9ACTN|nr:hypothetical protein [Streptomyces sp. DSM 44938]MDT0346272.1 hypothetical protein [Streptomyces sp. DSM 44938]